MKKLTIVLIVLFVASALFSGCTTTGAKSKFTAPQPLFEQVPEADQQAAMQANETLQEANKDFDLSNEKLHLAELREDLAEKYKKLAQYELKLARAAQDKATIGIDYARWNAIYNANIGDKKKSINAKSDCQMKIAQIDAKTIEIKKKIDLAQLDVENLAQAIQAQDDKVGSMEPGTAEFEKFKDFLKDIMKKVQNL